MATSLDLSINSKTVENIQQSFDRIAGELIHNFQLRVNDQTFSFASIEFYYFHTGLHEDIFTHRHEEFYKAGQWRAHRSGLDLTFRTNGEIADGGILIRNLKGDNGLIKGPIVVLQTIFFSLGSAFDLSKQFGLIPKPQASSEEIIKSIRLGLSKKVENPFKSAPYRYSTAIQQE